MGATVNIPEPQYSRLVAQAKSEGVPVRQVLLRCIEQQIPEIKGTESRLTDKPSKTGRLPVPPIKSKAPGTLDLTNEQIYDLIGFP
jgi:hypothetical protein